MYHFLKKITPLIFLLMVIQASAFALESYTVTFEGIDNPQLLTLLQSASKTVELQKIPTPLTKRALKRRAESDIPNLIQALHSLAYYHAKVKTIILTSNNDNAIVVFNVEIGPVYPLATFEITPTDPENHYHFPYQSITLQKLNIHLHTPALPKNIIEAEELLLSQMSRLGFPLAKIEDREVIADQATHQIHVILHVNSGPRCCFGEIIFSGCNRVSPEVFNKKIAWTLGDLYDPQKIEKTQNALEATGLFSSISITHQENVSDEGLVPIVIEVTEGKHRSIGAGVGYSTDDGFGVLGEWEHRNIRCYGEKVSFKTLVAQRLQEGTLAYVIPDFKRPKQDLIWLAEFQRQTTKGYHASSFSVSGIIERQVNDRTRISFGGMFKRLRDTHSDNNGNFNLIKTPFQLRWNNTNSILDPTQGGSFNVKIVPSLQVLNSQFAYCINTLTGSIYIPLRRDQRIVFAAKGTLGSIFGKKRHSIPPSERFYAGNENLLRGYHYMTVSPLRHREPIGGRSMMIYSLEMRLRATETIGWVLFYDFGNVYDEYLPQFNKKILQSVGVGLRYNTPVGPLRLDFAVPLQRRYRIDEKYQIYLSIGQAF